MRGNIPHPDLVLAGADGRAEERKNGRKQWLFFSPFEVLLALQASDFAVRAQGASLGARGRAGQTGGGSRNI
jgi:hypothetical protein